MVTRDRIIVMIGLLTFVLICIFLFHSEKPKKNLYFYECNFSYAKKYNSKNVHVDLLITSSVDFHASEYYKKNTLVKSTIKKLLKENKIFSSFSTPLNEAKCIEQMYRELKSSHIILSTDLCKISITYR
jgi:hypothetical protein